MKKFELSPDKNQSEASTRSVLEEYLREGARTLLQEALELEVLEYIEKLQDEKDAMNRRIVTRNGHLPTREVLTGVGPINVSQPRVRDGRKEGPFASAILPKYKRKTKSLEAVIPELYLRGISTNNFQEGLSALLGEGAKGLSAPTIARLKKCWEQEYGDWQKRDLTKRYVYIWADGIYFNIRLDKDRPCILVVIGVREDGKKELLGIHDGHRESKLSWMELLGDLKRRGLSIDPSLAIGDGALGFWSALEEAFPTARQQRCWVHKTANVLDKLPKSVQPSAKTMIHEMYLSPTKEKALGSYESFMGIYAGKYPGACKCLEKDKEQLFSFYDFPAEHWQHIRTTNPIESTFATVRHRTRQTKGCGSRVATLTMVFKLAKEAEKGWRRLRGFALLEKVVAGVPFKDGEEVNTKQQVA